MAGACLYFSLSLSAYLLTLFPPPDSFGVHWWTLLLPPAATILPLITLILDVAIKQGIKMAPNVVQVVTRPAFWL